MAEKKEMKDASATQVHLEEFQALRREIESHFSSMRFFTALNLTVFAAVLGARTVGQGPLSQPTLTSPHLLLVMPVLSFLVGLLIYHHCDTMSQIGTYVSERLSPALKSLLGGGDLLGWESYVRELERAKGFLGALSMTGVSLLTCFVTIIISLLLFSASVGVSLEEIEWKSTIIWSAEALLSLALLTLAFFERRSWLGGVGGKRRG